MFAIVVNTWGAPTRSYMNPGAALPVVGTDICGLPRNGVVSFGVSHGSILGCCLKSVNQLHAASSSTGMRTARRLSDPSRTLRVRSGILPFTANLLGSVLLEDVLHGFGARRIGLDP